jgi:hypothetical protein
MGGGAEPRGLVAPPFSRPERRGRLVGRTVAVVDVRREEEQLAVVGAQLERLLEDLERFAGAVELLVRPEERPGGPAGFLSEPAEAVAQEEERRRGLAEMARRDEVGLGVALVAVLDAGREPVELHRLVEPAAVPEDARERVIALGVPAHRPDGAPQERDRLDVAAGVVRQLAGVLLPEERRAVVLRALAAEQVEPLVPPAHLAEVAELLEQEVRVLRDSLRRSSTTPAA